MAARHQLHALRNHPTLQRFLIANARPTGRQLGAGSYGSVEELEVSGVVCAGKKIHESLIEQGNFGAENIVSKYVEECQLMSDLRHPHLVQFLGVCFLPNSTLPVLVMECLVTSHDDLLEHNPDIPLSLKRSILADVARGLVYLHSRSPPVIHRDLSARNVLLNSAMVAKITDLGNARIVNFHPGQLARTLSRIPGTMVYMPPEAFEATSKYGPSLDIFSFGHLSLFTITQEFPGALLPYTYRDPENPRRRLARTEVQRRDEYIRQLHQQLGEQHPLVLLVKQCLDDEPSERPSAQELLQQLEGMRIQIEDPYQHLNKLEAVRMLKEKDRDLLTQVEAASNSRQELEAVKREMEQLQLEVSCHLTDKDAEISRLGEAMRRIQQEYSYQLVAKDAEIAMIGEEKRRCQLKYSSQLAAKDTLNFRLGEDLRSLQAELEAREARIRDMGAETEQREAEIHRLMAELRQLQSLQLQKAPETPVKEGLIADDSLSPTLSEGTSSAPHSTPKATKINNVDQPGEDELQNMLTGTEAKDAYFQENGASTVGQQENGNTQPCRQLTVIPSPVEKSPATPVRWGTIVEREDFSSEDEDIAVQNTVDSSTSIASAVTSSNPHTKPEAATDYATVTVVAQPWQASVERLEEVWAAGTVVVGRYRFSGYADHDLPFKRGDSLTIISNSKDPNWYKARRFDGLKGMIPCNFVKKMHRGDASSSIPTAIASSNTPTRPRQPVKLQGMPWFHGDISRSSAEKLLRLCKSGSYLVRESENYKGDCTLCVSFGSKIEHYRLRRNDNYWVTVDNEQYFENLIKFVEHYQRDADGLCCRLRHPIVKKSGSIQYTVSVQDFKKRGWGIPSSSLQKESLIGKGEFKEVWLGEYEGQKVAMVMIKDLRDPMARKTLLAEAAIMTALRHPNLVCLIGVTLDKPPIYLITEYMAKGSFLDYLRSRGRAEISKVNQLVFARDVCKGMVYLESQNLVHRNLAARNVLIGDNYTVKLSDFCLTRDVHLEADEGKLLVKWTAPEALKENKFSNKSDVWSFGILLWEIYSYGRVPYPQVSVRDVLLRIDRGYRMDAPGGCPDGIYQIMKECWDTVASQRPNFAHIQSTIESIFVS